MRLLLRGTNVRGNLPCVGAADVAPMAFFFFFVFFLVLIALPIWFYSKKWILRCVLNHRWFPRISHLYLPRAIAVYHE